MLPSIIIADDDAMIRSVLRTLFESMGQTALLAATGAEAVDLASRVQAKLIMLDLNMPDLNGIAACELIRAMPRNLRTPIVILTALSDERTRRAATRAGATLFLPKPFQPAALLSHIGPFLGFDAATLNEISRAAERAQKIGATGQYAARRPDIDPNDRTSTKDPGARDRGKDVLDIYRQLDRRASVRFRVNLPCRISVPGQAAWDARVIDFSEGGARVRSGLSLPYGARGSLYVDGVDIALPFVVRGADDGLHLMFELDAATTARLKPVVGQLGQGHS
jgi:CheY-like chemotaxis protein